MNKSLLDYLKEVPDKRGRRGRQFRLFSLLALLVMAALNGESSLRGMVMWAKAREEDLVRMHELDLWPVGRVPSYSTFWEALAKVEVVELEKRLAAWIRAQGGGEVLDLDGKCLRGSKRKDGTQPLQVVTLMVEGANLVRRQQPVKDGDELAAALALLKEEPLAGKIVTVDAGLLERPLVKTIVAKKGGTSGR